MFTHENANVKTFIASCLSLHVVCQWCIPEQEHARGRVRACNIAHISPYKVVYQAEFLSSSKFGLPAQVRSKQNCPYHRSAWKEAREHFYCMGGQTDCIERSYLKIAELKNFARYDLCCYTLVYPYLLARSYAVLMLCVARSLACYLSYDYLWIWKRKYLLTKIGDATGTVSRCYSIGAIPSYMVLFWSWIYGLVYWVMRLIYGVMRMECTPTAVNMVRVFVSLWVDCGPYWCYSARPHRGGGMAFSFSYAYSTPAGAHVQHS